MLLEPYQRYYNWLTGMKKTPYLEVIEGRQDIHRIHGVEFDINDPSTYTTEEKETDINIATHMITKGFQNAYDIAILVSGDTDYVQVIRTLHDLGKIVVIAHFPEQNIAKYQGMYDAEVILDDDLLYRLAMHLMEEKRDTKRDILPGFHRKKIEFEFKLLYYNQKRRALSSSFFQSPGPDNIFFHQVVRCHIIS